MPQNAPEDARADIALLNRVIARDASAIGELYDRHNRLLDEYDAVVNGVAERRKRELPTRGTIVNFASGASPP